MAIIVSLYNTEITDALLEGALSHLLKAGVASDDITIIKVPGAVEIPLVAKLLAKKGQYAVIIALGAVVRGETSHYDYVCEQVSRGCQEVALAFDIPVVFGVLTTENEEQAWERLGGEHGHKGIEAAECALAMHSIVQQL